MSEANKTAVHRYIDVILNQGNLAPIEEIFAADSIFRALHTPEVRGLDARRQFFTALRNGFPDLHVTIDDLVAEGDKVAVRWTATGTQTGEWMGVAPSGRKVVFSGTNTLRFAEGKIAEELEDWDALGFHQQLGLLPESTEADKTLSRLHLEEVWNKGDLAAVDRFYASDALLQAAPLPECRGAAAIKQMVTAIHSAFPDIHYTITELVAEPGVVVIRWVSTGTQQGEWMGLAPTGKAMTCNGTTTLHIAGGKIVKYWVDWDALGVLQQLGAAPPLAQPTTPSAGE